jgi:hypothetical protein
VTSFKGELNLTGKLGLATLKTQTQTQTQIQIQTKTQIQEHTRNNN